MNSVNVIQLFHFVNPKRAYARINFTAKNRLYINNIINWQLRFKRVKCIFSIILIIFGSLISNKPNP